MLITNTVSLNFIVKLVSWLEQITLMLCLCHVRVIVHVVTGKVGQVSQSPSFNVIKPKFSGYSVIL